METKKGWERERLGEKVRLKMKEREEEREREGKIMRLKRKRVRKGRGIVWILWEVGRVAQWGCLKEGRVGWESVWERERDMECVREIMELFSI